MYVFFVEGAAHKGNSASGPWKALCVLECGNSVTQ